MQQLFYTEWGTGEKCGAVLVRLSSHYRHGFRSEPALGRSVDGKNNATCKMTLHTPQWKTDESYYSH